MRSAPLILSAIGALSLTMPAIAQQQGSPAPVTSSPGASFPPPSVPAARLNLPQRPGSWKPRAGSPRPGGWQSPRPDIQKPGWRWGEKVKGRWHGGWNAPGGWEAYQRPVRGWTLPSYWFSGGFWLTDWQGWGLARPPHGYHWVRYYDDAVLVDPYGRVWDSVSGIDWDRGDGYDDDDRDQGDGRGPGAPYDAPPPPVVEMRPPPPPVAAPPPITAVPPPAYAPPGTIYVGPGTTTITIQPGKTVTSTTTTVTEYVTYGARKTMVRAPTKRLYRAPTKVKTKTKTCSCR